jgi:hypothetical protein
VLPPFASLVAVGVGNIILAAIGSSGFPLPSFDSKP